jgi:hypothetical protein
MRHNGPFDEFILHVSELPVALSVRDSLEQLTDPKLASSFPERLSTRA